MRIGIIGLGFMGVTHLSSFAKVPDMEVGAVCTENPAVLAGDLSKIGGNIERDGPPPDISQAKKYAKWQDLVADPSLDAVDICLPTDLHLAVASAALAAGKHVLCEKPMARTDSECEQMIATAEKHKRILMIGQVLRFWPDYLEIAKFKEAYGPVRSATFVRQCGLPDWSKWLTKEERSGGAVLDLLVHDIDQALLLCGMPARVAAKRIGADDAIMATLLYPGGPEVRVQGGWLQPGAPLHMSFDIRANGAALEFAGQGVFLTTTDGRKQLTLEGPDGYDAEAAYFAACCRTGQQPSRCMPRDSAQAVHVALCLKQSRDRNGEQITC